MESYQHGGEGVILAKAQHVASKYRSKAEADFASIGFGWLWAYFGSKVLRLVYEPITFNLPGNRYTPDFMAVLADGRVVFVEIKGSTKQRGYRDARSKLRAAADMFREFLWCECIGGSIEVL